MHLKAGEWEGIILSIKDSPKEMSERWAGKDTSKGNSAPAAQLEAAKKNGLAKELAPTVEEAVDAAMRLKALAYAPESELRQRLKIAKEHKQTQLAKDIETILADRAAKEKQYGRKTEATDNGESAGGRFAGDDDLRYSIGKEENSLEDPDFKAWAKKKGYKILDRGLREKYDNSLLRMANRLWKRFIPNAKVKFVDHISTDTGEGFGNGDLRYLRKGAKIMGTFNKATGEVQLAKGAKIDTFAHELGWHAARRWAQQESAKKNGNPAAKRLLESMDRFAANAPQKYKDYVRSVYGDIPPDVMIDEIGAHAFADLKGGELAKIVSTKDGAAWYSRVKDSEAGLIKEYLTAKGMNRVDLMGVENKSPEQFSQFLSEALSSGRTLGRLDVPEAYSGDWKPNLAQKWKERLFDFLAPVKEFAKRTNTTGDNDAYHQAGKLQGRLQVAQDKARRATDRVNKILVDADIDPGDLGRYMKARAAEERNAKIAVRSKGEISDGSGMTAAEARHIIEQAEATGQRKALDKAADILWKLQREGLEARRDAGLIDEETFNKWTQEEPHHVPWRSAIDPESGEYVGRGVGGKSLKDQIAVVYHKRALDFIRGSVSARTPLSSDLIQQIHAIAMHGTPKAIEKMKRPYYMATTLRFVKKLETHPIHIAATFFTRFLFLWPFEEGNECTAYLVANFILMQLGYPPVVLYRAIFGWWRKFSDEHAPRDKYEKRLAKNFDETDDKNEVLLMVEEAVLKKPDI